MTTPAARLRASQASDALTRALVNAAARGIRPRCGDYGTSYLWLSEEAQDRRIAAASCRDCPVLQPCLESALLNDERIGVWGGRDFSPRPGKKLAIQRIRAEMRVMCFFTPKKTGAKPMTDQNNEHRGERDPRDEPDALYGEDDLPDIKNPAEERDPRDEPDALYGEDDLPDIKNPAEERDPRDEPDALYGEVGTWSIPDDDGDIESLGNP